MSTRHIPFGSIKFDAATQVRAEIDAATVDEYAEHMEAGDKFPPADVFEANGEYYIGDGWHRLLAAQKNGDVTFPCNVQAGGRTAAIKHALGANSKHGLKRNNADKLRAVTVALAEFSALPDRQIAELCGLSHEYVRQKRRDVSTVDTSVHRMDSLGRMQPASKPAAMRHEPRGEPEEKELAEEAPPVGGKLADVEQTARDMQRGRKINFSDAAERWEIAKGQLDNIRKEDPERVTVLSQIISYAQERISKNK